VIESIHNFESLPVNIMTESSKRMHVSDEVLCEFLQDNEYSDISETQCSGNSDMNVSALMMKMSLTVVT
jgi:hypothetical protein